MKTLTSVVESLNRHTRRAKVFGPGRRIPLDRNAKARIMMRARGYLWRSRRGEDACKGNLMVSIPPMWE